MEKMLSSETKLFSTYSKDSGWQKALMQGSVSKQDAANRNKTYERFFSRYEDMKEAYKAFSGYAEIPLLSQQYFNATMASYVRSFAGFLSIERDMDQPTALLWFMDLLGVIDNRVVLPNVGPENLNNINARWSSSQALDPSDARVVVSTNKKLIPGSIKITLVHAADPTNVIEIGDDRNGNLLAPAGILTVNNPAAVGVNYLTGLITFTIGSGFTIATGDSTSISGFEDVAGSPEFGSLPGTTNNRFKMDMKNIIVASEPDMLVAENNLMAIASMMKAIGSNPSDVSAAKLTELYTKLVNKKLIDAVKNSWSGTEFVIPMTTYSSQFYDYTSRLDAFQADLVNVDTLLANQSVKGVQATSYVVGENMGNWFRKLSATGNFVNNDDSSYINDLLGYFKGIPVLRHTDIGTNEGYAVHKTKDGQLAPVMRGIFLPLTNTPLIGNYNNPTQVAQGIYYQESNQSIVPELTYKFKVE